MNENSGFKKICNESYSSLENYINKCIKYVNKIDSPFFIKYNNEEYFVTGNNVFDVIINKDNMNSYVFYPINIRNRQIVKNDAIYIYDNNRKDLKKIIAVDSDTNKIKTLELSDGMNEKYMNFIQKNGNKMALFKYDLSNFDDKQLDNHLQYIHLSSPNEIYTIINYVKKKYIHNNCNGYFPYFSFFNNKFIDQNMSYKIWELFPDDVGFYSNIPKELVDYLINFDIKYEKLNNISKLYRRVKKM